MRVNYCTWFFYLFVLSTLSVNAQKKYKDKRFVVIGYVGGYKGLIDTNMVHAEKLTHINYAFVNIKNNRAFLAHPDKDSVNFASLKKLKLKNPGLKILISIGGWSWSGNFSSAALSDTSRKAFAVSAVNIVRKYALDGVDIDWEYPDQSGDGNTYRSGDKQNYTLMFKALRDELDKAVPRHQHRLLLTAAVGGFKQFLQHTEMNKVAHYLDFVNLMTYDYFQDSSGVAVHHTALYSSKKYNMQDNADKAVSDYVSAGVPLNKLVIGMAFYGRSGRLRTDSLNGLGMPVNSLMGSGGYTYIKDSLLHKEGFKYYRDRKARAPFLFNASTRQFISFDDEWSVKNKCRYVEKKKMAGVMFWEYADDKKEYLLDKINQVLK